jgi:hypothetical protein
MTNGSIIHTNQITSWLVHSCSTFGAWTHHRQTQTQHNPDLGEVTTFPLIVLFVFGHGACTQMSFCLGTLKLRVLKLKFLQFWRAITSYAGRWLRWGLKQSFSPFQKFTKNMWHFTCTKVNQGDSQLLMVTNLIAIWFLALPLAITYVLSTQMGHANPF